MNRTQKAAMVNVVIFTLFSVSGLIFFFELFFFKTISRPLNILILLMIVTPTVIGLPLIFKKQSRKEVESDERDKLIELKAVLVACVSGWILLAVATLICRFAVGINGSISIWALTLINFGVFLLAFYIYAIAILVQYYAGGRDGK